MSYWIPVNKGNSVARGLADAHYNRQSKGNKQFCRPGHNVVLLGIDGRALWVSWKPANGIKRMDNLSCFECTIFRNEGEQLSSLLIQEAVAITERVWSIPPDGWITFVDKTKVKSPNPGYCFLKAGWYRNGRASDKHLIRLRLRNAR